MIIERRGIILSVHSKQTGQLICNRYFVVRIRKNIFMSRLLGSMVRLKPRSCAQFAPGVYFWPCERCFNLLLLSLWCKFICTRVQICRVQICSCFRCGANLFAPGCKFWHPGANCAHERKLYNFYTF